MPRGEYGNLVDGRWRTSRTGETEQSVNPADTREVLGDFPAMARGEVVEAIEAAAGAFPRWRSTPVTERASYLFATARVLRKRAEELARDVTREVGKTIGESRGEVAVAADLFDLYAGYGRRPLGDGLPDGRPGVLAYTRREPIGVFGLVTPWSDPLLTTARKLAPALLAGNTAVAKPSDDTPLATHRLAEVLEEAGFPAGVVNTVTGDETMIGGLLLEHPAVRGISFTGSTSVGREFVRRAGERDGLRVQAAMGAKNAALVLGDADIEEAAESIAVAAFAQGGQHCAATSRVFVTEDAHGPLVEALAARADRIRVGDGLDEATDMGALAYQGLVDRAMEAVAKSKEEGAVVAAGGSRPEGKGYDQGYFFAPTVLDGVARDAWVSREELFGPVLSVTVVNDFDEGLDAVNDSAYGLAASVYTRSLAAAHRFAERSEAGNVCVNLPTTEWEVHLPFGGIKDSGSESKEQGPEALQFYTRIRTVTMKVDPATSGRTLR